MAVKSKFVPFVVRVRQEHARGWTKPESQTLMRWVGAKYPGTRSRMHIHPGDPYADLEITQTQAKVSTIAKGVRRHLGMPPGGDPWRKVVSHKAAHKARRAKTQAATVKMKAAAKVKKAEKETFEQWLSKKLGVPAVKDAYLRGAMIGLSLALLGMRMYEMDKRRTRRRKR